MRRLKSEAGFTLIELLIVMAILGFTMAAVLGIYQVTQRVTFFATAGEDAQLQARAVLDRLVADFQLINSGRTIPSGAITEATSTATPNWDTPTSASTRFTFLADYDNTVDSSGNFITVATAAAADANSITVTGNPPTISCGATITVADGPIMESHALAAACKTAVGSNTQLGFATDPATGAPEKLSTSYPSGTYVRSVETLSYAWDFDSKKLCRNVGSACPTLSANYDSDTQLIAENVTKFRLTFLDSSGAPTATLDLIRAVKVEISVLSKSGDQTVTRTMQVTVRARNFF